ENYFSYLLTALKNITYQTEQVIISLPKMPQDEIVIDLTCAGSGDLLSPLPAIKVSVRKNTKNEQTQINDNIADFFIDLGKSALRDHAFDAIKDSPLTEKISSIQTPELLFLVKFILLCVDQFRTKPVLASDMHDYNFYNEVFRLLFRLSDAKLTSGKIQGNLSEYLPKEVRAWVQDKYPRVFVLIDDIWACLRNTQASQKQTHVICKDSVLPIYINMLMFNDSAMADRVFDEYKTYSSPDFMSKIQEDVTRFSSKYSFYDCQDILELTATVRESKSSEPTGIKENAFGKLSLESDLYARMIGTKSGTLETVKSEFAAILPDLASSVSKVSQFPAVIQLQDKYTRKFIVHVSRGFDALETAKLFLTKFITVFRTYQKERLARGVNMSAPVIAQVNKSSHDVHTPENTEVHMLRSDREKLELEIFELEAQLKTDLKYKYDRASAAKIQKQIKEKQEEIQAVKKQIDTQWFGKFFTYLLEMNPEFQMFFNDLDQKGINVALRDDLSQALGFVVKNSQFIQAHKESYMCVVNFLEKKKIPAFFISALRSNV
ncbi:MAG: hypothetical protein ABH827_06245, partial [bacterium]